VDPNLWASRRSNPYTRLRDDPAGCNDGVREELAAGVSQRACEAFFRFSQIDPIAGRLRASVSSHPTSHASASKLAHGSIAELPFAGHAPRASAHQSGAQRSEVPISRVRQRTRWYRCTILAGEPVRLLQPLPVDHVLQRRQRHTSFRPQKIFRLRFQKLAAGSTDRTM